ncbi:MAG: diguanylate cyclase [Actinobacteria bacterium]|nr:ABC transporter permease [Actinomycetota bacterium]PLS84779.1 MAG: diguanylate cyclase [Actinomycetota bacterium]
MISYVIRKVLFSLVVLVFASIFIFGLVSLAGDPLVELKQNPRIRAEDIQRISAIYGLDRSYPEQYLFWIKGVLQGDLGTSFKQNAPVNEIIGQRIFPTVLLMGTSILITMIFAIPFGIYSAIRKYSWLDNLGTFFAFLGFSMPIFWLALILQLVFGVYLTEWAGTRVFYTSGISDTNSGGGLVDLIKHLTLPALSLAIIQSAVYSRFQRSAMLDVLSSDYLRTARAKGLSRRTVYLKHALRNALIPTVTLLALYMGTILGGAIITETVFAWPGLGFLFADALFKGDFNVARGILLLIAVLVVFFNLVADLVYAFVDPRISYD